jgi:hypothetical protein
LTVDERADTVARHATVAVKDPLYVREYQVVLSEIVLDDHRVSLRRRSSPNGIWGFYLPDEGERSQIQPLQRPPF